MFANAHISSLGYLKSEKRYLLAFGQSLPVQAIIRSISKFLFSCKDDLPISLSRTTAQWCKTSTSVWRLSLKNVVTYKAPYYKG